MAAFDRTQALGLNVPPRILVDKDSVDPDMTLSVLLDYFDAHDPQELVGQTLAINLGLIPLLFNKTGVPFELTIGWIELDGKARWRHEEETIKRFLIEKSSAWQREGVPFHILSGVRDS